MRKADGWYVSILTEREIEAPVHPKAGREIGLDAGVKKTAALSNGKIYLPVDAFRSSKDKLAKMQRRLKRMVPHSENWKNSSKKSLCSTRRSPTRVVIIFRSLRTTSAKTTRLSIVRT